jgi:hypothetical protein
VPRTLADPYRSMPTKSTNHMKINLPDTTVIDAWKRQLDLEAREHNGEDVTDTDYRAAGISRSVSGADMHTRG